MRILQRLRWIGSEAVQRLYWLAPRNARHRRWTASMPVLRSLSFHCRLIKYDPDRALQGYSDGSWTAMRDVGTPFEGITLTLDEYLRVEQLHLDVVRAMAIETGTTRFRSESGWLRTRSLEEALEQVRAALRDHTQAGRWWVSPRADFYLIVGWDYHLHVGSKVNCVEGVRLARGSGLHPRLEEDPSPYLYP